MYLEVLEPVQGADARVLLEPLNRYESGYLNGVANLSMWCSLSAIHTGAFFSTFSTPRLKKPTSVTPSDKRRILFFTSTWQTTTDCSRERETSIGLPTSRFFARLDSTDT